MEKWTRWQVWLALLAGAYAALSPVWTETDTTATRTMVVLGVVTAGVSLWSLMTSEDRFSEYAVMIMGVLLIASPWVMGFDNLSTMRLTAVITGAVAIVAGILAMPQVEDRMHLHHRPIAH